MAAGCSAETSVMTGPAAARFGYRSRAANVSRCASLDVYDKSDHGVFTLGLMQTCLSNAWRRGLCHEPALDGSQP